MYMLMVFMGEGISVEMKPKSIHLANTSSLQTILKRPDAPLQLAKFLKERFIEIHGHDIHITAKSLAIEILGHVYVGNFAEVVKKIPHIPKITLPIVKTATKVTDRTDVIDCGEKDVDSNRWIWDRLAMFYDSFVHYLYEIEKGKK
ncbi:hypothetical protein [Priestia taiwanensis]|uniref:Uncharacterized protein n=1 Tax=Priestia taiwanensis TaxID=1347902 RepID=A0A917AVQ3_9BACI|nr:hypothetical protein [Priestia taiwanensis]MBM7364728.1 hypothetical protein [Priestia taiwanensis]GGE79166.1 hypothetical protein GCM10007140_30920 [Priestia taiwanensis]